jgi:methyl-accepting chemotaxis protein
MPSSSLRIPIGRKLLVIQALLFAVIVAIGAFTFVVLERVVAATEKVGTRYAPQTERMASMQLLMFRISLEARHAMPTEQGRIQRTLYFLAHMAPPLQSQDVPQPS